MSPAKAIARLRRLAEDWRREESRLCEQFGGVVVPQSMRARQIKDTQAIYAAVEMIERLEDSEQEKERLLGLAHDQNRELVRLREECRALRAKIAEMERQEPVAKVRIHKAGGNAGIAWSVAPLNDFDSLPLMRDGDRLYALPGAQNAPSVPNLDMDALERQNDETKEEVGKLRDALALIADQYEPKCNLLIPSIARSALCATGAYGQTEAQPAQSVPDGWKLVPIEPTPEMRNAWDSSPICEDDDAEFRRAYSEMLAAAPEAKP